MWKSGTLTDAEFASEKQRVLSAMHSDGTVASPSAGAPFGRTPTNRKTLLAGGLTVAIAVVLTSSYAIYERRLDRPTSGTNVLATFPSKPMAPKAPSESMSAQAQPSTASVPSDEDVQELCMHVDYLFSQGGGMELVMRYAPDLRDGVGSLVPRMGGDFVRRLNDAHAAHPNVDWDGVISKVNAGMRGGVQSRENLLPMIDLAVRCSKAS
jgi:hypothetical protein